MKKLVILIGPQGSGNHLFSKVLGLHPDVYCWPEISDEYFPSHRTEPFNEYWRGNKQLEDFDWDTHDYFVTSISYPLSSFENKFHCNVSQFITDAERVGIDIQLVVIGRDQNIIHHQQTRVRVEPSLPEWLEYLPTIDHPVKFVSYELLYLYKDMYLESLDIGIPIFHDSPKINEILSADANSRYVVAAEGTEIDNNYPRKPENLK